MLHPEEEALRRKKSDWYQHVARARGFADVLLGVVRPRLPFKDRRDDSVIRPHDSLYWRSRRHTEAVIADLRGDPLPADPEQRKERKNARRTEFYKDTMARLKAAVAPYIDAEVERRVRAVCSGLGITVPTAQPVVPAAVQPVAPAPPAELADVGEEDDDSATYCDNCDARADVREVDGRYLCSRCAPKPAAPKPIKPATAPAAPKPVEWEVPDQWAKEVAAAAKKKTEPDAA